MISIDEITEEIIRREGGYVNDVDDPGGATKYGVTLQTMRRLGLDINQDGQVDTADIKTITIAQVTEIYINKYYFEPRIDKLPTVLQASVYDMNVNSGSNSIKILQRLLNSFGEVVTIDGVLGSHSLSASWRVWKKAPNHINDAYGIARRAYYYRLADLRIASRKYARKRDGGKGGWIIRAEEFISKRFHFSLAQHIERTSTWD